MISYIWTGLLVLACVTSCFLGRGNELAAAVTDGAGDAVTLCLTMVGLLGLWSGMMELMEQCGIEKQIANALHPVIRRLFPKADQQARQAISANLTANLLGLSNAATPFGLKAAQRLHQTEGAENNLLRFLVLNTTSIQLVPTTVAAVRASMGAENPFDIMPAIWCASIVSVAAGLMASVLFERIGGNKR